LRFPFASGFRAYSRRNQAAQRRVCLPQPAYRHRGDARHAVLDHPAYRRHLRSRHSHRRQGTARVAWRGAYHPCPAAGPGAAVAAPQLADLPDGEFLLVTAGGGGDGEGLVDWVLAAYEDDPGGLPPVLAVFGPFMLPDHQAAFAARAARLPKVRTITFDTHFEHLMARAAAVVAMGGYNTFCEILSFDKPALIVPRTAPRLEQYIRAQRAAELGLVTVLSDTEGRDPRTMAAALLHLTQQSPPSAVVVPGLLDGMARVNRLTAKWRG